MDILLFILTSNFSPAFPICCRCHVFLLRTCSLSAGLMLNSGKETKHGKYLLAHVIAVWCLHLVAFCAVIKPDQNNNSLTPKDFILFAIIVYYNSIIMLSMQSEVSLYLTHHMANTWIYSYLFHVFFLWYIVKKYICLPWHKLLVTRPLTLTLKRIKAVNSICSSAGYWALASQSHRPPD